MKTTLTNAHVITERSSELPYQVWATATDPQDTSRAASAYICSTDDKANADLIAQAINSQPETLQALTCALETVTIARRYFPKSIHNRDRFQLENTCATIGKAIKGKG